MPLSAPDLGHVTDWVFDLDNTLYPRECNLFAQIDMRMTEYMMNLTGLPRDPARKLQKDYYREYGTTLNAVMKLHGVDPEDYLAKVHDIDYSPVQPDPSLVAAINALPGRKFIFTNADSRHAANVLARLGAADAFEGIFDIRDAGFRPKPDAATYASFLEHFGVAADRAAMFDDLHKNLVVPHELGMATVQVVTEDASALAQMETWELDAPEMHRHVHYATKDLAGFLSQVQGLVHPGRS